jgi:biopolymer transport protein ExbB/TolQ
VCSSDLLQAATARVAQHPARALLAAGAAAPNAEAAWDAISAQAALVEPGVRGRVNALAAAGNIATMLGLLGTVYGLILAFQGLGDTSSTERAARLSEGISTAMNTTAYGLLVGIPALGAHAGLDGALRRVLATCEAAAGTLLAWRRGAGAP